MTSTPRISVVTIVKNNPQGFLITAKSILEQSYDKSELEWIVVDGLSDDCTTHYVKALAHHMAKCIIEDDSGIYNAMNKGIKHASGDWMFFMNADDAFYSEHTIQAYVDKITEQDDFVFSDVLRREDKKIHAYRPEDEHWLGMAQDHQTVCGKVSIYKSLMFDEAFKVAGDFDFFSRARNKGYSFRKLEGFIGCIKPFDSGASSEYFKRQKERIRVIKVNFPDMPYSRFLGKEYEDHFHRGNLTDSQVKELKTAIAG